MAQPPRDGGNGWSQYQLLVMRSLADLAEQDQRLESKHDTRYTMLEERLRRLEQRAYMAFGALVALQFVAPLMLRLLERLFLPGR